MEVYVHTNKINGKRYVGKSKNSVMRWGNGTPYKRCPHFWAAIQKYGWDNFEHTIILTGLSNEEANKQERFYISFFHSDDPKYGYNLSKGGEGQDRGKGSTTKEGRRRYMREWYKKNRQERLLKAREYRINNQQKCQESHKKWIDFNREHYNEYMRQYKKNKQSDGTN